MLGMRGCEGGVGVGVGECELERGRRRTFYMCPQCQVTLGCAMITPPHIKCTRSL